MSSLQIPLATTSRRRSALDRFALVSRYFPVLLVGAGLLAVSCATRIAVLLVHGGWPVSEWHDVLQAFASGSVYDMLVAQWLLLPAVTCLTFARTSWLEHRRGRVLITIATGVAIFAILFVATAETMFFAEFDGRFNFVAVDYLIYPTEIVTNVWESYPTAWVLGLIACVTAAIVWPNRARLRSITGAVPAHVRLSVLNTYLAMLILGSIAIPADLSRVSSDRALNEVASNGYYAFVQALRGRATDYDALYATREPTEVVAQVHRLLAGDGSAVSGFAATSTLRHVAGTRPARSYNVVVVLEESLGSQFVGALGASPSLTPRFDSLIAEGTLLAHAYSTGNRTIRALEATTASLPPLPGISVVRRPESVDLFTLPALLRNRGYATEFIYGGRAIFDGMATYMHRNGIERIVEQKDFPAGQFTNAWGVADEAIFDKAITEMDSVHASGKPFYTLILSVSNHRPYTYPAGRIPEDPNERKRVNVVQYADWALGRFVRTARDHPFFENTIFVLLGDHGPRVYGSDEIPLASYEVPVLFYAPGIVRAGARIGTVASSMDIAPTILGLLGGGYDSKFFGRDVLAPNPREGIAVMTHNNEIALLRGHRLAVLGLRGAINVYDVGKGDVLTPVVSSVGSTDSLASDAIAYYQTADALYRMGGYRFERRDSIATGP